MHEQALEGTTATKSHTATRVVEVQLQKAEAVDPPMPQRDPLIHAGTQVLGERRVETHASLLQQQVAAAPARAAHSMLQLQQLYGNQYLQRVLALRRDPGDKNAVDPAVEQTIHSARGSGQALDSSVRIQMEPAFGADFSSVRVHTGVQADTLNRALNARAFTTGHDVFFRQGAYDPGSSHGRELLAHELTHVLQQHGGSVQRKLTVGPPGDRYEQEADQVARTIVHREQQAVQPGAPEGARISRQTKEEEKEKTQTKLAESPLQRAKGNEDEEKKPVQTKLATSTLQRAGADEEEQAQTKAESLLIQRQVEDEEDSAQAKRVESPVQRQAEEEEKKPVQTKLVNSTLQRAADEEEQTPVQAKADLPLPPTRQVIGGLGGGLATFQPEPPVVTSKARSLAAIGLPFPLRGLRPTEPMQPGPRQTASIGIHALIPQKAGPLVAPPRFLERPVQPPIPASKEPSSATAPGPIEASLAAIKAPAGTAGPSAAAAAPPQEMPSPKATAIKPETTPGAEPTAALEALAVAPETVAGVPEPETEPKVQAVMQRLERTAGQEKRHGPAAGKVAQARAAAEPPAGERKSRAQAQQVEVMDQQKAGAPDEADFVALLLKQLEAIAPENMDQMEKFKEEGKAGQLKTAMTQEVNKQKEASAGDIKAATKAEADPESVKAPPKETPVPKEAAERPPESIGAQEALPSPKREAEVSLQENKQRADQLMAENDVDEKQLNEANEPQFSAALTAKKELAKHADQAPAAYRTEETGLLAKAQKEVAVEETAAMKRMRGGRSKAQSAVQQRQQAAKQREEEERQKVTDQIQSMYQVTKQKVEAKLTALDGEINTLFDAEERRCRNQFESYVTREMRAYKAERYSGLGGGAQWLYDAFAGLPDEVNRFYETGKKQYIVQMKAALIKIGSTVKARLKEAKDEIASGKKAIADYVAGLPKTLQKAGSEATAKVADQFGELEQGVEAKKQDLAQKLVQRAKDARGKLDERIKQLQEENKGLLTDFIAKIKHIIKVIRDFKERVSAMLKKSGDVVSRIAKAPIQFLKHLIGAVKLGFNQFSSNIGTHLKRGLIGWLFGTMSEAGIELPSEFSAQAVFGLILQVLGLTADRIRAKLAQVIGAKNMKRIEQAWAIIAKLIQAGPGGLWEMAKQYLSDLKDRLLDEIKEWLITEIVKQAVIWVVSLFNPVSALFKAIQMIYNVVMFFIENIERILQLVEAVIASIVKIVAGDIAAAADWIENAMARAVPIMIAFLARLLNLGGIAEKVKTIIKKIQKPVDKVIDTVLFKIVSKAKGLLTTGKEKLKRAFGKGQPKPTKIIDEVKMVIAAMTKEPFKSLAEAQKMIHQVFTRHQPKGLKKLRLVEKKDQQGAAFEVEASASPSEDIGDVKIVSAKPPPTVEIDYEADSRGRPTRAYGWLRSALGRPEAEQTKVSRDLNALVRKLGMSISFDAAHLIADRFGGEASTRNLVPMEEGQNKSFMGTFENYVAKHQKEAEKVGAVVFADVRASYPTDPFAHLLDKTTLKEFKQAEREEMESQFEKIPLKVWFAGLKRRDQDGKETSLSVPRIPFFARAREWSLRRMIKLPVVGGTGKARREKKTIELLIPRASK